MQPPGFNFTAITVKQFAQIVPKDASSKGLQKELPKDLQPIFFWRFSHPEPHTQKWSEGSEEKFDRSAYFFSLYFSMRNVLFAGNIFTNRRAVFQNYSQFQRMF